MDEDYAKLRGSILSLNISENETFDFSFEMDARDERMQVIKALINTESNYLIKITKLLKEIFNFLDKKCRKKHRKYIATKDQLIHLFQNFPTIYCLHATLNKSLKKEMKTSQMIGKVLFEFLSQEELLNTYEDYVRNISGSLSICKIIEIKGRENSEILSDLKSIIMGPIQRFPQLNMVITDLYRNTFQNHEDKVNLFKAMLLTRSITSRLDIKQRNYEYNNFKDIAQVLLKLKLSFSSTKLLSTHSVFKIKIHHFPIEKVIKIPYYLILCDQNIILFPKEVPLSELSTEVTFSYSLKKIDLENPKLSNFIYLCTSCLSYEIVEDIKDPLISMADFKVIQDLYFNINNSSMDQVLLEKYKKLLHDYWILNETNENMKKMNFSYENINVNMIAKTLLKLGLQLKETERKLNAQFCSIVLIKHNASNFLKENNIILFDSCRIAKEWRISFNRTRLLSSLQTEIDWLYYPTRKDFSVMSIYDLPLVFQPFSLKDNNIVNIESGTLKYEFVNVVVGSMIFSCLWICLPKGRIIISYFDYKQWKVLESFTMMTSESITNTCSFTLQDPESKQIIDSEIWMSSGKHIFIHSLIKNRNSEINERINFASEIMSLCSVENNILIGLKSKIIKVYSKDQNSKWFQESEISLQKFLLSNEEIKEIQFCKKLIYIISEKKIIINEKYKNGLLHKNIFVSDKNINTLSITSDGVWMSFCDQLTITLYDVLVNNLIYIISLPLSIFDLPPIGNITSTFVNKKYIWIGTANGFIITISSVDSSYCVDSNVPMYFSSRFSSGPITQLVSFQTIEYVTFNKTQRSVFQKDDIEKDKGCLFSEESLSTQDFLPNKISKSHDKIDEIDALCDNSLKNVYKNWKNCNLTLMLAFGTGISKADHSCFEEDPAYHNQSTIFTFFE